jgi:hypothetical protein
MTTLRRCAAVVSRTVLLVTSLILGRPHQTKRTKVGASPDAPFLISRHVAQAGAVSGDSLKLF